MHTNQLLSYHKIPMRIVINCIFFVINQAFDIIFLIVAYYVVSKKYCLGYDHRRITRAIILFILDLKKIKVTLTLPSHYFRNKITTELCIF